MESNSRQQFGRRVAALRRLRLLSQDRVAKLAGVSQKTVSAIELYGRGDPRFEFTLESADKIAKALGYEVWQLLLPIPDDLDTVEPDASGFRRLITALDRLIVNYAKAPLDTRQYIDGIAERDARYLNESRIHPSLSKPLAAAPLKPPRTPRRSR